MNASEWLEFFDEARKNKHGCGLLQEECEEIYFLLLTNGWTNKIVDPKKEKLLRESQDMIDKVKGIHKEIKNNTIQVKCETPGCNNKVWVRKNQPYFGILCSECSKPKSWVAEDE